MVICGVHSSAPRRRRRAAARVGDRLFQHLLIELDADLADMAGLLLAQQIAGAADVEIVAGQREAGAELVERLHHFEPALRRLGQHLARRQGQIGIGAQLGAADAAAQLVELRQAEHVGAMDDQRVGGRDVEAGFDDVGREQHVVVALVEGGHHLLELGRRHLAMRHRHLHLGHQLAAAARRTSSRSVMRGTT